MEQKKPQRIEKEQEVARLQELFENANAVIMTDYRGITVAEDTALRAKMRENGINYIVAKNTMLKLACNNLGITDLDPYFAGPTAIAFSDNPVELSKIISTFIKEKKKTQIKVGLLDRKMLSASDIDALSKLPSREVLLAKLLGSMQSPLVGFASVSSGLLRQLVTVVDKVREQKEAS
ncbi:MAG: 50S ribosomal protein L10 [Bacillota bacterium]|jgi:large subunit ribosomal protein L10